MEELPGYIHIGEQKKELVWKIVCLKVNVSKWVKWLFTEVYADRKDPHIWNWSFIGQRMKNLGLNTVSFYGNNLAGVELLSCLVYKKWFLLVQNCSCMSLPTVTQ